MGTGAKIAIGCGIAVLVTGTAVVVGIVGLGMWGKSKLDALAADQKEVEALEKKADANPFTAPEDGVVQEPRLVKFIEARQRVFPIYEKYQGEFASLHDIDKKKEQPDFSDVSKAVKAAAGLLELRKAHLQALADIGMSREEYRYLVQAVYQSWWAAEIEKSTGKTPGENSGQVESPTGGLDVPPANIALFRRYEADIKKYAMTGLEALNF